METTQDPIIRVSHLSKRFVFWKERPNSLKTVLVDLLRGKLNMGKAEPYLALDDISFEVSRGEFIGIMGKNGAGKSTLFKILSGIYVPTSGTININGTITPLIELGAGFHPDLSGYENIFLNAAILGFGKKATADAVPAILEFAELGDKIAMPIKNYSSGMLVRLGFSIATHLAADILLIDEVLAVGDVSFQRKCLNKIHELHREGRTILLITHDPSAVVANCKRCIVISEQRKIFDGSPEKGAEIYLKL